MIGRLWGRGERGGGFGLARMMGLLSMGSAPDLCARNFWCFAVGDGGIAVWVGKYFCAGGMFFARVNRLERGGFRLCVGPRRRERRAGG